jgi:citrate synthase
VATLSNVIDAKEAALLLGVKRDTLYAYVARGLLGSVTGKDKRSRLYSRAEVEALRARSDARKSGDRAAASALASALNWGLPVVDSAVSNVDGERLLYRGIDVALLAGRRFEDVATLLWGEPTSWGDRPNVDPTTKRVALRASQKGATPLSVMMVLTPLLALTDEDRGDTRAKAVAATAQILFTSLTTSMRPSEPPRAHHESAARQVLLALGGSPSNDRESLINTAMVLSAEHELNPSTFAARIAASTGADPYAVVSAALATLSGPRHGGACDRIEALVREVEHPRQAREILVARVARGEPIVGFGHALYPNGDPRTGILLEAVIDATSERKRSPALATLLALVNVADELGLAGPTLDVALVATEFAAELPPRSASALFAFGRLAGWIAHAIEEYARAIPTRPRARYVRSGLSNAVA